MTYQTIIYEPKGHVLQVTLNRPEVLNCVNIQMWQELGEALDRFAADTELRVAVLTGAGDRSFCAGADLKAIARGEFRPTEQMIEWGFAGIVRHFVRKPVIAAVNGFALGGGTEIALACDLVVAAEEAEFGLPEVSRGVIAGAGGVLRLPRQIPQKVAMYHILTGEPMTAHEAQNWGLVAKVVPQDQVVRTALDIAERISQNSPLAVQACKEIVYKTLDVPLDFPGTAWDVSDPIKADYMRSEDFKEGPRAFAEKRKPVWKGR